MFVSVIVPTYNRRSILEKCLPAIAHQDLGEDSLIDDWEVIVVDDGSTDDTIVWLTQTVVNFPRIRWFRQNHLGPAAARNLGLEKARGDTIVFIDSDLVVTPSFLAAHAKGLKQGREKYDDRVFTYGRVINTSNFDNPTCEPYKLTDFSAAYFATGNVAISRHWLDKAGHFDTAFSQYGWEDLELGVRLKQLGLKLIKCPEAVGYHLQTSFTVDRLPSLIDREIQRGRMGLIFYQKHPTWEVRMMVQMTPLHQLLWGILSLGGTLNERTMAPFLRWLVDRDRPQLALEIARIFLNWYNVRAVYQAYREWQRSRL